MRIAIFTEKDYTFLKHSSILPSYRGLFPIFWALLGWGLPIGMTIHKINQRKKKQIPLSQPQDFCFSLPNKEHYQTLLSKGYRWV